MAITVAALSKARNVISHSNTWIVGSTPTRGISVCVYSLFLLSCAVRSLATGLISPVQGILGTVYDMTPNSPLDFHRRFGGTHRPIFMLKGVLSNQRANK
jgi:hypothetical protein